MTRRLLTLLLVPFLLACEVSAEFKPTPQATLFATQSVSNEISVPTSTAVRFLPISGCWNIRPTASTDGYPVRVACDETFQVGDRQGAWVQVTGGWICAAAFGLGKLEDCR